MLPKLPNEHSVTTLVLSPDLGVVFSGLMKADKELIKALCWVASTKEIKVGVVKLSLCVVLSQNKTPSVI